MACKTCNINPAEIAWRSIAGDINAPKFDLKRHDRSWLKSMSIGLAGHPRDRDCAAAKAKIEAFLEANKR